MWLRILWILGKANGFQSFYTREAHFSLHTLRFYQWDQLLTIAYVISSYPQVEKAQIIQDLTYPSVTSSPEDVKSRISIYKDAYSATKNTHAIVLCTEWDEFIVIILFFDHPFW